MIPVFKKYKIATKQIFNCYTSLLKIIILAFFSAIQLILKKTGFLLIFIALKYFKIAVSFLLNLK
jgi:hypothetical protein